MVPSAIYRYYANRDELVTALVVDAYSDLGAAVSAATGRGPRGRIRTRWLRGASALRAWAQAEPARFQLLYGSPVAGYAAPSETIGPATGVLLAVLAPVVDAAAGGTALPGATAPAPPLRHQLEAVATGLEIAIPPALLARAVGAWAELVGLVVLELGGHFVGGFDPADALLEATSADAADRMGLHD